LCGIDRLCVRGEKRKEAKEMRKVYSFLLSMSVRKVNSRESEKRERERD
jgi:hypothetical protein